MLYWWKSISIFSISRKNGAEHPIFSISRKNGAEHPIFSIS
jgi:hypothetical protein